MNGKRPDSTDMRILWQLEKGLPLVPRPFADIGDSIGLDEDIVIERLKDLVSSGVIKRFGVVVRHHEVGFGANAMVVWDVPDQQVTEVAALLTDCPHVTLCYRRPRKMPEWPYNLFCMIHGTDEQAVQDLITQLRENAVLAELKHEVLFSERRFKQTGARYQPDTDVSVKREVA